MISGNSSSWSRVEDKLFERALVAFSEETPDMWEKIASQVPGKTLIEVRQHYEDLVHDVREIDSGRVELPSYEDELGSDTVAGWDGTAESRMSQTWFGGSKGKERETERRKGVPWTEEEHRLFLIGLQRYGKGDWRSISRNAVVSRTPTQVASHAQKYFLRLSSGKKDRKRSSIHDITTTRTNSMGQTSDPNWIQLMDQSVSLAMEPLSPTKQFKDRGSPFAYQGFGFPM